MPFDPTPLSAAALVWMLSASTPSMTTALEVGRAPPAETICVPRPNAPASFNCEEVPGESVSNWVKLRVLRGSSLTVLPSTTRPRATVSVCSSEAEPLTSMCSVMPAGCITESTAMRSVTASVAFSEAVAKPAMENSSV